MPVSPYLQAALPVNTAAPVNGKHPLAKGLLAWWLVLPSLGGGGTVLRDLVGVTHGTLTGMAMPPTSTSGWQLSMSPPCPNQQGPVLAFNGSTDYVDCGTAPQVTDLATFSLASWIYPTSYGGGGFGRIFCKSNDSTDGFQLLVNTTSTCLQFAHGFATTPMSVLSAVGNISLNTWTHVLVTWPGTTTASAVTFYINGRLSTHSSDGNGSGASGSDAAETLFFGDRFDHIRQFAGYITDFRIFNRVLSAQEAYALYMNTRLGYPGLLNRLSVSRAYGAALFPGGDEGALWYLPMEAA